MDKNKKALESAILNTGEIAAHSKILRVYNLKLQDFESEELFDDYLEEREMVIFCLVHNLRLEWATERIDECLKKYSGLIDRRNAEMWQLALAKRPKVLPLLGQLRYQARSGLARSGKANVLSLQYSDNAFLMEMRKRGEEWKENQDVTIERAGGASPGWLVMKAKEELKCSLFR
jgi:hypothetical protein